MNFFFLIGSLSVFIIIIIIIIIIFYVGACLFGVFCNFPFLVLFLEFFKTFFLFCLFSRKQQQLANLVEENVMILGIMIFFKKY